MTVFEWIRLLSECEPDAQVHFVVRQDEGAGKDLLTFEELYDDDTDVDIRLCY